MPEVSEASLARFKKLARQLAEGEGTESPYREGFGTGALFVGRKMFGVLDRSGALVLKLSPRRVSELIATGVGAPWHPGNSKPLKEYVAVGIGHQGKWLGLAREARAYMQSKR